MVLFYFLSKVNAIGLLTHSYQKSCALRGSSVHKTRIYNLEKKFGVGHSQMKNGVRTYTMLAKIQIVQNTL